MGISESMKLIILFLSLGVQSAPAGDVGVVHETHLHGLGERKSATEQSLRPTVIDMVKEYLLKHASQQWLKNCKLNPSACERVVERGSDEPVTVMTQYEEEVTSPEVNGQSEDLSEDYYNFPKK